MNLKVESKKLEDESNITFKPILHTKPKTDSASSNGIHGSRFDKLYSDAMKRQQESSSSDKLIPGKEELTFRPQISSRASSRSKRAPSPMNVTDRLYSQSGSGRPSSKSISSEDNPNLTFKPQISKRAESAGRNQTKEISDRLYQLGKEHQNKINKLQQDYIQQKVAEECTFAPNLSKSRSRSTSRATNADLPKDVASRLFSYEEQRQKKLEEAKRHQQELEAQLTTFKPHVIPTKRAATPNRGMGNPGETIFDRLARQTLEKDQIATSESAASLDISLDTITKVNKNI